MGWVQIFGKDSILNLGQKETQESRDQWVEDMDVEVSSYPSASLSSGMCYPTCVAKQQEEKQDINVVLFNASQRMLLAEAKDQVKKEICFVPCSR